MVFLKDFFCFLIIVYKPSNPVYFFAGLATNIEDISFKRYNYIIGKIVVQYLEFSLIGMDIFDKIYIILY